MFSQDHIFPSRVLQSECGHGYTGRLVPGNIGDTGTEGRLRRPQQETKHGSQMCSFFFRDWGGVSLCCFPFLYATLLLILKKSLQSQTPRQTFVRWNSEWHEVAFSTRTHFSALSSYDYKEAMRLGGRDTADMVQAKPRSPDNMHSASQRAVGTWAEHELNHPCFRNDVVRMGDL